MAKKKIVRVEETESKSTYGTDRHGKIVKLEEKGDRKGRATKYRIASIICWLLALGMEVLAVMYLMGKIPTIASLEPMKMLLVYIVADLVFFIPGAICWKKANHIDPISEKKKVKFFLSKLPVKPLSLEMGI